jgi:superfamily II DNA/RNA helicase
LSAEDERKGGSEGGDTGSVIPPNPKLTALVLCPTRELAMQVSNEYSKLVKSTAHDSYHNRIKCGSIVGGLSEQKQKRILNAKRPPVLVATPGRLWDLVRNKKRGCTFYFILKVEEEILPLN